MAGNEAGEATAEARFHLAKWGLFGEWWCVARFLTAEEEAAMCAKIREDTLGDDFAHCPEGFIRDRLYGGFACGDGEERRHVFFDTAAYSFTSAIEGRYQAYTSGRRRERWRQLLERNPPEQFLGDGPFMEDMPPKENGSQ